MRKAIGFDDLEDRRLLSHPGISHPGFHQKVVYTKPLTAAYVRAHDPPFGGGGVNLSIPFVLATPGISQNALNFTSNTYNGVIYGYEWPGILEIASLYNLTGNSGQLYSQIATLAFRMPYGQQALLPLWDADLSSYFAGTLFPRDVSPTGQAVPELGEGDGGVADILFGDLQCYLAAGLGQSFNISESAVFLPVDYDLSFDGFVN